MNTNRLLDALRQERVLLGLCNMYPAPGIIEGMTQGWDFVWVDGQHGQMGYDASLAAVRAAQAMGLSTMLRIPGHEPMALGTFADIAPSAIMVPMINTLDQARAVVSALRFPPLGTRSYGGRRSIDLVGRDYYQNLELAIVAQIETPEAVEAAESIASVEGVDVLFFGPDDMKVRLGLPINTSPLDHPQLRDRMRQTVQAARAKGKFAGCVATSGPAVRAAVEMGYQMIVTGGDSGFLRAGAAAKLQEARAALADQPAPDSPGGATGGVYG